MKKLWGILIIIGILIISLNLSFSKKEGKITIKFSSWGSESELKILQPLIKEFEQKNPDIKVEFLHIPNNYFQKLHLLVASNLAPDVVFLNNINGQMYVANDIFLDLNSFLDKDNLISRTDFFDNALKAFTYKNKLYAIPRDISNLVIYYNKDIFEKENIAPPGKSWNMDEFLATAQKLTKDFNNDGQVDRFGFGFEENPLFWLPFLWSNGGGIIDDELKNIIISKPESVKWIQFYADLRSKYHVAPTAGEAGSATMSQLFMQGKLAMHISGRWSVPRYRKDIKFNWDVAKFPSGTKGSIVDADASGWGISKQSKYPQKSWRLIKFLANKKAIEKFTGSGLIVPSRQDVANSNVFLAKEKKPSSSEIFINIIPQAKPTPANKSYQEIIDLVNQQLEPVWNGKISAKEAIDETFIKKLQSLL